MFDRLTIDCYHYIIFAVSQFDEGIQRFMAMRATAYEHFRPNPKNSMFYFGFVVFPVVAVTLTFAKLKVNSVIDLKVE